MTSRLTAVAAPDLAPIDFRMPRDVAVAHLVCAQFAIAGERLRWHTLFADPDLVHAQRMTSNCVCLITVTII